jgi:hypothetical protein
MTSTFSQADSGELRLGLCGEAVGPRHVTSMPGHCGENESEAGEQGSTVWLRRLTR